MFLAWIEERGLLPHDASTNILAALPPAVQLQLIAPVVATVGAGEHRPLSSEAHVAWAMEAIGRGFALVRALSLSVSPPFDSLPPWRWLNLS